MTQKMMIAPKKRIKYIVIGLVLLQIFIFLNYHHRDNPRGLKTHTEYLINKLNKFIFSDEELEEFNNLEKPVFFSNILALFDANPPKKMAIEYGAQCKLDTKSIDIEYDEPKFTEDFLSDCLKISYDVYESLIKTHEKIVSSIPSSFPKGFYSGDGMVMVGGGKYGMLGFLVIKQLRDLGSTIPVQVFIPDKYEDEKDYCENILPLVNATCITTASMFSSSLQKRTFSRFQLKMLAILSSSFENVLFLDSDSFALASVEHLFDSEPFKSTGLVVWPDFWRRSTSPAYYKIAGKSVGKRVRHGVDSFTNPSFYSTGYEKLSDVPLHDREGTIPDGSSEAGEILINKYKHLNTLLLTLYYNVYGPEFYYDLFTQKCYGKGDKETFIAAAHTLGNPYYQIKRKCEQIGDVTSKEDSKLTGMGLLQFDPVKDYEITQDIKKKISKNPKLTTNQDGYDKSFVPRQYQTRNQDLIFLHANHGPKFDVNRLMLDNKQHRRFGHDMTKVGFDFEGKQFQTMKEFICDKKLVFTNLREGVNVDALCEYINREHEFYESTKDRVKLTAGV